MSRGAVYRWLADLTQGRHRGHSKARRCQATFFSLRTKRRDNCGNYLTFASLVPVRAANDHEPPRSLAKANSQRRSRRSSYNSSLPRPAMIVWRKKKRRASRLVWGRPAGDPGPMPQKYGRQNNPATRHLGRLQATTDCAIWRDASHTAVWTDSEMICLGAGTFLPTVF